MTTRLWSARVTLCMDIVVASDSGPTRQDWVDAFEAEVSENWYLAQEKMTVGTVREVTRPADLPDGWADSIPYGDDTDGNTPCAKILAQTGKEQ